MRGIRQDWSLSSCWAPPKPSRLSLGFPQTSLMHKIPGNWPCLKVSTSISIPKQKDVNTPKHSSPFCLTDLTSFFHLENSIILQNIRCHLFHIIMSDSPTPLPSAQPQQNRHSSPQTSQALGKRRAHISRSVIINLQGGRKEATHEVAGASLTDYAFSRLEGLLGQKPL